MLTIDQARATFPALKLAENGERLVYLDSGATTQKPQCVLDALMHFYTHDNANPNRGVYELAARATDAHENARIRIARFMGATDPQTVIFVRNATEALNIVAKTYGAANLKPGDEVCVYVAEHHSNMVPWQEVCKETGATLVYMYPDASGILTTDEVDKKIGSHTKIVAVAEVSNVLGTRTPVEHIVQAAHANGAKVVLDCAQSIPHMAVNVESLDVDFAAWSGHKIYSPMGIGILYGKRELLENMPVFLTGGDMINTVHESGATWAPIAERFEAGTVNVGGEVALAAALDFVDEIGIQNIQTHESALNTHMLEEFARRDFITVYGPTDPKLRGGPVAFNIKDVHPHDTSTILDAHGVAIRAGHHCAQPLMEYMGSLACARASVGVYNTMEDIDILVEAVDHVRKVMSL